MPKNWKHLPTLALIPATALIGFLVTLAAFQYKWLGELSDSELELTRSALRAGALRFSEDFDHELTSAFVNLQMHRSILREDGEAYAKVYDQWVSTTLYPKLVSDLYIVKAGVDGQLILFRFSQERRQIELADWPANFEILRQRLAEQFRIIFAPDRSLNADPLTPPALIDGEIPALIIPMAPRLAPEGEAERRQQQERPDPAAFGWTIARLDLDYIKQEVLPTLAKRYFSGGDGRGKPDYNLLVVSRRHPDVTIYSSVPGSRDQLLISQADVKADLFRLQLPLLARMLSDKVSAATKLSDRHSPREHGETPALHPGLRRRFLRQVLETGQEGQWRLALIHRAGSLQNAVADVRRRNLMISFGVLALLFMSVVMIFILIRRLQRLAEQQMEFVAGVSHELRTPVAVLCSASENLADGMIQNHEEVLQYGEMIRSESYQLAELVEQALEFAETQSLRNPYHLSPVPVADVIDSSLASIAHEIVNNGFTVEKTVQADLPPVMADRAALGRGIRNLLNNAMKFSGDRRLIEIRARTGVGKQGKEVMISVGDHGIGIEPEELKSIFKPFRRGKAAISSQIHGSGLGLSLVKHIIEGHRGEVNVRSVPGQGSVFTLHLPVGPGLDPREPDGASASEHNEQTHFTD
ncbi:MAG: HAMP domain-containing histidine kinase [Chloracidobacterium sp.]|nr:HAMP domain-containing histidine kinase [Chloracidobacterium sp.]